MTPRMLGLPLALAALAAFAIAQEKPAAAPKSAMVKGKVQDVKGYEKRTFQGFNLIISQKVLDHANDSTYEVKPLDVLEDELKGVGTVVPTKLLKILQSVSLWVEWDEGKVKEGGGRAVAVYRKGGTPAEYAAKGLDPRKANNMEIMTLKFLTEIKQPGRRDFQQIVVLHELLHVIHDKFLTYNHAGTKQTYSQAMDRGLYDNVKHADGFSDKAYAATNEREYFAEIGSAYLDKCIWYPHTADDLKTHDPAGYKLMEGIWGKREQLAKQIKPVDPAAAKARAEQEKLAAPKLSKARTLITQGKKAEGIALLEEILKDYANTTVAADAKKLLDAYKK